MEGKSRNLGSLFETGSTVVDYPPEPMVVVVVHCERYSCLGYVDQTGIWRSRYGDSPLGGRVVAWEQL